MKEKGNEMAPHIGAAFQFEVYDAGSEGIFFVDLRPGYCSAGYGLEPSAEFKIIAPDADIQAWLTWQLDEGNSFWSGRITITDDGDHKDKIRWIYGEACKD